MMKILKKSSIILIFILSILICGKTLGATDEFKAFLSDEIYNDIWQGVYYR